MKLSIVVLIIILFVSLAWNAQAEGLHMDFGLAYHNIEMDSFQHKDGTDISNIIGEVELFYEWKNGTSITLRHNSDTQKEDSGLNMIIIKARLF